MQLDKKTTVYDLIALASCSLLGVSTPVLAADTSIDDWKVDTAILYYNETDRVSAVESAVSISKNLGGDKILSGKITMDSLSGSSHNGAAISDYEQTFTSPSGEETYTIAPGDVPLDPNFEDDRNSFSLQMSQPLTRVMNLEYGAAYSSEYDYKSLSVNASLMRDFNQRNTTLSAGFSYAQDEINPRDGLPVLYSLMSDNTKSGSDTKNTIDLLMGVTQVINRNTIMQFNYGFGNSTGYHNDPYKIVSIVSDATNAPLDYLFENRPDSRTKHSLYWQTKHHFDQDMVDFSLRLMADDWGVNSQTLDMHYRWNISDNNYLEPHVRYYTQSAADFYEEKISNAGLTAEQVATQYQNEGRDVTADYRLGNMDATTIGVKWGARLFGTHQLTSRIELYQQSGDSKVSDVDAIIFQVGYGLKF
ncbi:MAG: hypothetical protein ACJAW8_000732 [Oleispira sp.]|jgi:hypothetical protein|tara:strand:+ start:835 stop:2088 length:1254 start_codon:yes stop_codon:yes gene_type:complete